MALALFGTLVLISPGALVTVFLWAGLSQNRMPRHSSAPFLRLQSGQTCRGLAKSSVSQLQFKIPVEIVNHPVKNAGLGIGSAHRRASTFFRQLPPRT